MWHEAQKHSLASCAGYSSLLVVLAALCTQKQASNWRRRGQRGVCVISYSRWFHVSFEFTSHWARLNMLTATATRTNWQRWENLSVPSLPLATWRGKRREIAARAWVLWWVGAVRRHVQLPVAVPVAVCVCLFTFWQGTQGVEGGGEVLVVVRGRRGGGRGRRGTSSGIGINFVLPTFVKYDWQSMASRAARQHTRVNINSTLA